MRTETLRPHNNTKKLRYWPVQTAPHRWKHLCFALFYLTIILHIHLFAVLSLYRKGVIHILALSEMVWVVGLEPTSLVNPNHAVYQLTYTQIFGVSRTSADFHAWSLPFPLMLYEAPTLNPSALCRLCTDTGKHLGDFIFTFVAPILEGYLGI